MYTYGHADIHVYIHHICTNMGMHTHGHTHVHTYTHEHPHRHIGKPSEKTGGLILRKQSVG